MNKDKENELREEFYGWCNSDNISAPPDADGSKDIAKWWLIKLSQALEEQMEAIRQEIIYELRILESLLAEAVRHTPKVIETMDLRSRMRAVQQDLNKFLKSITSIKSDNPRLKS